MKYFLKTMGCQMNVADSNVISNHMLLCGFKPAESYKDADIIIVNTCTVRAMAEHKALSFLGEVKKHTKNKKVIVAGCAAQQWGESIKKRYPNIQLVVGAKDIEHFPVLFDKAFGFVKTLYLRHFSMESDRIVGPEPYPLNPAVSSFVTIMRGCENFCSYCIVPYVRGKEISRPPNKIIYEIEALVKKGAKEVTLLGQNVNSYRGQETDFTGLLEEINMIKGLERIRFMTSHPKDLSDKLINAMAKLEKVCSHIHLPLQAGSDKILNKMNRGYKSKDYLNLITKLRKNIPNISITTDILIGFPGETEKDFNDTLKVIKKCDFDFLFAFKYSARQRTVSYNLKNEVDQLVKEERLAEVLNLASEISAKKNAKLIGTKQEVLVDDKRQGIYIGNTGTNKKVFFESKENLLGKLVWTKITASKINSLIGKQI